MFWREFNAMISKGMVFIFTSAKTINKFFRRCKKVKGFSFEVEHI
jgi:hypothetical protein